MNKKIKISAGFLLFILSASICRNIFLLPKYIPALKLHGSLIYDSLKIDGKKRDFYLYNPDKSSVPNKLLLVFHPATENGIYMRKITGYSFDSIGDNENIFICYPNAYDGYWNDRLTKVTSNAVIENVNEVSFIKTIIKSIEDKYQTRLQNIYLVGLSQGGEMVYRLCIEIPDKFTAVAIVAANLGVKKDMRLDFVINPVSMLIINGRKDPICPYMGGEVNFHHIIRRGYVYSAETTVDFWARCAGYKHPTSTDSVVNAKHSISANILNYDIMGKKNVCLYSITDGGHSFPNPNVSCPKIFGNTNHDMNAADIAWAFFKKNTVE